MEVVYLLLGANLGDRFDQLEKARTAIAVQVGKIQMTSSLFETKSWGVENQADYLNQAIMLETNLSPQQVLAAVLDIENQLGRVRDVKWDSRIIDIDILFYGDRMINDPDLIVPHPYFHARNFAIIPMLEIAPAFVHPIFGLTIKQLQKQSTDALGVKRVSPPEPEPTYKVNLAYLEDLTSGDPSMIREIIELFLKQTPGDLSRLESAIEKGDWISVKNLAHHIKPTLSYVGAENIRDEMQWIERCAGDVVPDQKMTPDIMRVFERLKPKFEDLFAGLHTYLIALKK